MNENEAAATLIARRLTELTAAKKKDMRDLCFDSRIDLQAIRGYISGLHTPPAARLKRLAGALETSVDDILKYV